MLPVVDISSCNDGHRGKTGRLLKSVKEGIQLEKNVLTESDFPSEVSDKGGLVSYGKGDGGISSKRKGRGGGGVSRRKTKCELVCVCVRETEILSIYLSKQRPFLSFYNSRKQQQTCQDLLSFSPTCAPPLPSTLPHQ